MIDQTQLEPIFTRHGCYDFKWIAPDSIVVANWVRMKCMFGCKDFGQTATCPPNTPSVDECRTFFSEYIHAVMFHFSGSVEKPEDRHDWTKKINARLLKLERDVFLAGFHKTFVLFVDPCNFCEDCMPNKGECLVPQNARPSPEGMAIDVFATARNSGFTINVLTDYSQEMNRYGILLIA
jgi:predicted metal-binding protein